MNAARLTFQPVAATTRASFVSFANLCFGFLLLEKLQKA
jgi:hypothetical protein